MSSNGGDMQREDLWRQYGHALDEYRFQVQLNWDRAKYLLTLDVGVVPAATALLGVDDASGLLVSAVYLAGFIVSVLGAVTLKTQRGYYRSTRELKGRLERELDLGQLAIRTTPGMETSNRSRRRIPTVHHVQTAAFIVLGLVHLVGVVVALR